MSATLLTEIRRYKSLRKQIREYKSSREDLEIEVAMHDELIEDATKYLTEQKSLINEIIKKLNRTEVEEYKDLLSKWDK